jgi:hypothetical protein
MCIVFILQQTATFALYNINWFVFFNRDEKCLLRSTNWVFKWNSLRFVFKRLIWILKPRMVLKSQTDPYGSGQSSLARCCEHCNGHCNESSGSVKCEGFNYSREWLPERSGTNRKPKLWLSKIITRSYSWLPGLPTGPLFCKDKHVLFFTSMKLIGISVRVSSWNFPCFTVKRFFFCERPRSRSYGRTAALRLLVQPCDEDERWSVFFLFLQVMEHRWNEIDRVKPVPVPLCLPQIPHGLTRDRTWVSAAVGGQRLTGWAMARPSEALKEWFKLDFIKLTLFGKGWDCNTDWRLRTSHFRLFLPPCGPVRN